MARKFPTYFFLDVQNKGPLLHRWLHINRSADTIEAWCYPLAKRVAYTYSDVLKQKDPAFTTVETGKMLNRGHLALERAILSGSITRPQFTYGLDENQNMFKYMWHETNILEAHAYFSTVHFGRPRNDGRVNPKPMPNQRELRAMIRGEQVLYVKQADGTFVPTWRAQDFS